MSQQKLDIETIVSGLLHDSIEDTTYTGDLLKKDFGDTIHRLVMGVTKISGLKYHGLERHAESLRKFIISMSEDVRVVVIKLCDRLHNIKSIKFVREEKRKRIALETIEIYARLADRLGMGKLKSELEDTAFPFVDEEAYRKTIQILNEIQTADNATLEKISNNLKEELKVFDVHIQSVDYRVKRLYSL
ncbi:MAG: HD domain-containing protein [Candidatus Pacebacteria bacterium]|nr:HD domain-containing protein [Candidatus Paceibacterota bacterium]